MQLIEGIKKRKNIILIAMILIVIAFSLSFISSFSSTTSSTAWDGIAANSFTSGTGTSTNPYVISSASEFAYFKDLLEGENAQLCLPNGLVFLIRGQGYNQ